MLYILYNLNRTMHFRVMPCRETITQRNEHVDSMMKMRTIICIIKPQLGRRMN